VDIVSIHRYPFPKSMATSAATKEELYASVSEWENIIPALRSKILELTGKELPVAVTEVNSHWTNVSGQEASPDSYANAVWWAGVLSHLIEQEVDIVAYFSLQSNASTGAFGLFERYDTRLTYHVYQIFNGFGKNRILAQSHDKEVSVLASQCDDGDITVLVVNLSLADKQFPLEIFGTKNMDQIKAVLLADGIWAEEVAAESYYDGQTAYLPAESVLLLTFSDDQQFCQSKQE